jgi:CRP-like cAMP-binding protein
MTAETCLVEHCEENEIDLNYIPQEVKDRFIEACIYTPFDVPLEQIASDTGLTRETVATEMERRRIGGSVGVNVQGLRGIDSSQKARFRELLD